MVVGGIGFVVNSNVGVVALGHWSTRQEGADVAQLLDAKCNVMGLYGAVYRHALKAPYPCDVGRG